MLYYFMSIQVQQSTTASQEKRREKALAARLKSTQNGIRWTGVSYQSSRPSPLSSCHQGNKWIPIRTVVSDVPAVRQMHEPWGERKKANVVAAFPS